MEAWFVRQWQINSVWQCVLRPVSWCFGMLVWLRRAAYRMGWLHSFSVGVPVIVVGNITVGGSGKTPLVLALAALLTEHGKHVGIVSRGYVPHSQARQPDVMQILPGDVLSSDEATLLARRSGLPVYIGADRVAVARALLHDHPTVNVIISDDGLQHYALRRDVEICVIDGVRGLSNGAQLPAGPLRERASRLDTVDAIVVNGVATSCSRAGAFAMSLANESFVNLKTAQHVSPDAAREIMRGKRIHALAGIGHPARFFEHLGKLGFDLQTSRAFPDHHDFLGHEVALSNADIILMTEKDAVKWSRFADERMWFMRVEALLPADFVDCIMHKLPPESPPCH